MHRAAPPYKCPMPADLSNLAIHTITMKQWTLTQCVERFAAAGVGGISVWRNSYESTGVEEAAKLVRRSGLRVPALVRGGFFPAIDAADRQKAVDDNRRCVDEAEALGAEMVVLVCGAVPRMPLAEARKQVEAGIEAVLPHAEQAGVKLAIEPLHPMYAADRSCVNRLAEARALCESLQHPLVGIALDVYHVWWDPDLEREIELAGGQNTLFAYHVCDWKSPEDLLNDRGLMGEGVIDLKRIGGLGGLVRDAGFAGLDECEIFSTRHWSRDADEWFDDVLRASREHC